MAQALAVLPESDHSASAWNDMGRALQRVGRLDEAVPAFRKALLPGPVFPLARNNLEVAERQLDLKKSQKAGAPAPAEQ
jgi:Flp pilus assembly protein TadD